MKRQKRSNPWKKKGLGLETKGWRVGPRMQRSHDTKEKGPKETGRICAKISLDLSASESKSSRKVGKHQPRHGRFNGVLKKGMKSE